MSAFFSQSSFIHRWLFIVKRFDKPDIFYQHAIAFMKHREKENGEKIFFLLFLHKILTHNSQIPAESEGAMLLE